MQFDVYVTPGRAREFFPYLVNVQSDLVSEFKTRYVVPLLPLASDALAVRRANPLVEFAEREFLFVANQLANIDRQRLGSPVGNLARHRDEMIAAIDFMLAGI